MYKVGIVGGGPGGLLTAYFLEQKIKNTCQITLFEASSRTGGKILTEYFRTAPVIHEAGVAELYSYQKIGEDPLLDLIHKLKLKTIPMQGKTIILEGKVLHNKEDIKHLCGAETLKSIEHFRKLIAEEIPLDFWYESSHKDRNNHPWSKISLQELFDNIADQTARKYIKVAAHSDLATEPHLTTALYGADNCLIDVPGYIELYTLEGGIEQFPKALKEHLTHTEILLNSPVVAIEKYQETHYRISYKQEKQLKSQDFDAIFICLPINWLNMIEWRGDQLRQAMVKHMAYYHKLGHYLRVSLLFQTHFWSKFNKDSWFISDAFGGVCIYDESMRYHTKNYGVLSFLLAGNDAETMANFKDNELVEKMLEALPDELSTEAKKEFLEGKVDRWVATVSALPGGYPVQPLEEVHQIEPSKHSGIFLVGDYLFDTTINGVMDSADFATDMFVDWKNTISFPQA